MSENALFKLTYGLFILTTKYDKIDNGCIINTVQMITENPTRITIAINKNNYTTQLIAKSKIFNISILTKDVPFAIIKHFGFQSGKDVNKFEELSKVEKDNIIASANNGVLYINKYTNAYIEAKVIDEKDYDSHVLITAEVTNSQVLSNTESVTYEYYLQNIKEKASIPNNIKGYECRICGYIYQGEVLPPDFECPICGHGPSDFEPIKN